MRKQAISAIGLRLNTPSSVTCAIYVSKMTVSNLRTSTAGALTRGCCESLSDFRLKLLCLFLIIHNSGYLSKEWNTLTLKLWNNVWLNGNMLFHTVALNDRLLEWTVNASKPLPTSEWPYANPWQVRQSSLCLSSFDVQVFYKHL